MLLIVSDGTPLFHSPECESHYSGDDPAGVCNMESIQEDPLYPPVHLRTTGYFLLRFSGHLLQSRDIPLRYVSS